ncbi:MAG TPA: PAS domain S-box protein [Myxococcota bacterium]|nr:PAS domain S-box protein [Myxococcota bacterium]HQK51773.1 PAS domain S-box protein [Myxococcota bacterium]
MAGFRTDWMEICNRLLDRLREGEIGRVQREDLEALEDILTAGLRAIPVLVESREGTARRPGQGEDPELVRWLRGLSSPGLRRVGRGSLVRALRALERAVFQESARSPGVSRWREEIQEGFLRLLVSVAEAGPTEPIAAGTSGAGEGGPTIGGLSPERLLGVLDSLGNPIFLLGPDLRVTWCNQAASWMFRGKEAPGGGGVDSAPAIVDMVPEIPVALAAMEQGGQAEASLERRVETRHGPRHFHLRIRRLVGLDGREIGRVVVMTDLSRHLEMEKVLRQARTRLEEKVQERTDELERLNQALLAEVRERNETEAVLRESEARWRSLVDLSPDGVLVIRQDRVVFYNQAAARMLGIPREMASPPSLVDLVHPDDREEMTRRIAREMQGEVVPERREARFVDRTGRVIDVEMASSTVVWQRESAIQMVIRDVRVQRRLLREAQQRVVAYDAILEARDRLAQGDLGAAGNEVARCLGKALGACRVFYWVPGSGPEGYAVGGLYGELAGDEEALAGLHGIPEGALPWFRRAVSGGDAMEVRDCADRSRWPPEWVGDARGAVICPVRHHERVFGVALCLFREEIQGPETRLRLVRTVGGYLGAVLANLWMYRRFREAETRFRSIFENALEGMYACTPDHCLVAVNPSLARILGHSDPTAMMIDPEDFRRKVHADPTRREAFLQELREKGQVMGFEYPARRADGRKVWVSETAWAIRDERGETVRYEGVIEDVSRRRELEDQLLQSQKQEALGRLTGGIAHDFNNLLTIILGYLGQVLEDGNLPQPTESSLREVEQAALRAAQLTRQLLIFGRSQPSETQAVELTGAVRGLGGLLKRLLGEQVLLEMKVAEAPLWSRLEGGQLDQVLINLAINSRDAMPDGGRLIIEVGSRILLDPEEHHGVVLGPGPCGEIRVTDTGVGMGPEVQARIFEPFFSTKGSGERSGLGLAVVYGIVHKSGGIIRCESEPGKGTTMRILLPLVAPDNGTTAGGPVVPVTRSQGAARVLLVEDEGPLREFLRMTLEHAGYEVLVAPDGAAARQRLQEEGVIPDLLVSDLVMPGEGGQDLARSLRQVFPGLPVLFISGYSPKDVVDPGSREASWTFLQKPFQRGQLLAKVEALLAASREAG